MIREEDGSPYGEPRGQDRYDPLPGAGAGMRYDTGSRFPVESAGQGAPSSIPDHVEPKNKKQDNLC